MTVGRISLSIYKKAQYLGELNATHSGTLFAIFIGGGRTLHGRRPIDVKERDKTCFFCLPAVTTLPIEGNLLPPGSGL